LRLRDGREIVTPHCPVSKFRRRMFEVGVIDCLKGVGSRRSGSVQLGQELRANRSDYREPIHTCFHVECGESRFPSINAVLLPGAQLVLSSNLSQPVRDLDLEGRCSHEVVRI
jgi:hypothetical protein